jgi:hypothetical protein
MQATAGGLGGGITRDGRAPAAPDAERSADKVITERWRTRSRKWRRPTPETFI